ncbi:MAG: thioredoxin family protein [Deltaproteobacteria bacterium]|nr:thioredoxin family protein [Deltaproteobacteria bacterium]
MLHTNLQHILSDEDFQEVLQNNDEVMICCGRMGPMCLPVYDVMEKLEESYSHVAFRDLWFDGPASHNIRSLPETRNFMGLPFVVYFKGGKVVAATSGIQNKAQVKEILDREFGTPESKVA